MAKVLMTMIENAQGCTLCVICQFQKCKVTHNCMWEIYAFTVCTLICWCHCDTEKKKDKIVLQHCIAQRKKIQNLKHSFGRGVHAVTSFYSSWRSCLWVVIFPCNAACKEYFGISYPASAGVCCDALTCLIDCDSWFNHFACNYLCSTSIIHFDQHDISNW